jgi:hypothetical protein
MISNFFYNITSVPELNKMIYSDEGNQDINILNKRECTTSNNQKYSVIRYNKHMLNNNIIPTYGLCRSIIINQNKKIVSFAPPKSILSDDFITKYPVLDDSFIIQEFVEGTMINVFWDSSSGLNGNWEISTRNSVGAETSFYQYPGSKTFRVMFLEALKEKQFSPMQ